MANTYTLISSTVLGSNQTTVNFSSIPQTYTDLVLSVSARTTALTHYDEPTYIFNSDSSTNYSITQLKTNGNTFSVGRATNSAFQYLDYTTGSTATANAFSYNQIYIPNYTSTSSRPSGGISVSENNSSTSYYLTFEAALYRGGSAISSLTLTAGSNQFVTGSSFYLYGIKNA